MTVLRVLVVVKTNEGGRWVIPQIREMIRRGFTVAIILPPGRGRLRSLIEKQNDVAIIESGFSFSFRPRLHNVTGLLSLRGQIKAFEPHIVNYHLYASALAVRLSTLRLSFVKAHMVAGPLYLESPMIRYFERMLVKLDSHLVAGSEHTARLYKALGMAAKDVTAIPYGVDTLKFSPPDSEVRRRSRMALGIPSDDFVAIIVSYIYGPKQLVHSHTGIKGHDILLDAWRQIGAHYPKARLLIVGSGFDQAGEEHRRHLIEENASRDLRVMWIDSVDDVRPYYAAADVSISPSISENHGAALEAGASGLPNIVSDAGGLPETVDTTTGWIVPRGDADRLAGAIEDAIFRHSNGELAAMGAASRRRIVARFDSATAASRLVDLLERLARPKLGSLDQHVSVGLVSEARLGVDFDGTTCSVDAASGRQAWGRYADCLSDFTLIARTSSELGSAEESLGPVRTAPLPYYVGLGQALTCVPRVIWNLYQYFQNHDVVVLRLPGLLGFLSFPIAKIMRKPIYVEVVGDPFMVLQQHPSRSLRLLAPIARTLMKVCVRSANGTRFVTKSSLQKVYPPDSRRESLSMSNVQLFDEDFNKDYILPSGNQWTFTAIGSQETDYKGHDNAISVLGQLRTSGYDCRLVLVGRGAFRASLEEQVRQLRLTEYVTFIESYATRHELYKILDNTDIFLHPSRTEGLPRVVIEAMARSRPVVATSIGGLPELIDRINLVEPNDLQQLASKVHFLLNNRDQLLQMATENYESAKDYHYDRLQRTFRQWCTLISHFESRT